MRVTGGVVNYYHADGLGSIVALTDANEAVVESYSYTSFGAVEGTGSVDNPYAFTGREWDPDAGLYHYRARYFRLTRPLPLPGCFLPLAAFSFPGTSFEPALRQGPSTDAETCQVFFTDLM